MSRFPTASRARRDVRLRADRVQLNDLFKLFPELPGFQRRPIAEQFRRVRENIERVQRHTQDSMARDRARAARVRTSWLSKRSG